MRAYFTRRSKMPLARGSFCGNANKGGGKRAFCCLQKLPLQLPFGRRRVNMGAAPGSSIHGSFLWAYFESTFFCSNCYILNVARRLPRITMPIQWTLCLIGLAHAQ